MRYQPGTQRIFTRIVAALLLSLSLYLSGSYAATLLPPGKQSFFDTNGNPLSAGKVFFYIPSTLTPKTTWQDENRSVANTNPVILDSAGRAIIYGTGCYRQIVTTAASVPVWDQPTCDTSSAEASWSGLAGGTPNAITLTADNFTSTDGQVIRFIAAANNSGAMTINPNGIGPISVVVDSGTGPIACTGNEIISGNLITVIYDSNLGVFHLSTLTTITAGAGLSTSGVGSSGGTIATAGTLTNVQPINAQTGTTYTVLSTDNAKLVTFNNSSAVAVTLPAATGNFGAGFSFNVLNKGPGTVTITPSAGTISGAATLVVPPAYAYTHITSDGTNWIAGYGSPGVNAIPGAFTNLVIANTVGNENTQVTITALGLNLYDSNNNLAVATNVNVNCNYATTGAGGLDTGALAATTWYYHYVIYNGTTTACLGSTSATSPSLPSGYTFKMRVGAHITDGSSTLKRIKQQGRRAQYVVTAATNTPNLPVIVSGAAAAGTACAAWGSVSVTSYIPTSVASAIGVVAMNAYNTLTSSSVCVAPNTSYGFNNSTNPPVIGLDGGTTRHVMSAWFGLDSSSIAIAAGGGTGGAAILTLGWEDNL